MTDTARGHNGLTEFLPKIVTVWREGYSFSDLKADALAGLTVAIVALPLSMAIAIASGVGPERGLYTAIVGGFLVSALGGSRVQIGGPAGAFIVLVSACTMATGVQGLVLATFLSGFMLIAAGRGFGGHGHLPLVIDSGLAGESSGGIQAPRPASDYWRIPCWTQR